LSLFRWLTAPGRLLGMSTGAKPVAILCLGHVDEFYSAPMLEQESLTRRRHLSELVFHDT
jgi:5,6-dimethylbenzimidazole synthase